MKLRRSTAVGRLKVEVRCFPTAGFLLIEQESNPGISVQGVGRLGLHAVKLDLIRPGKPVDNCFNDHAHEILVSVASRGTARVTVSVTLPRLLK